MKRTRTLIAAIASLLIIAIAISAAITTTGAASDGPESGNRLAGTWIVTVNRPAPLPPLSSLQVFTSDGSVIEMANESQATRTASYGSWERIKGRLYAASAVFFRFNAQGEFVGSQKINRTIKLGPDGNTFKHVAKATVLDANGNVLTTLVAHATGERMQIERIPDQP